MAPRTIITEKRVKSIVRKLIRDMPDTKNPWTKNAASGSGNACLYTAPRDKTRHCIVGQVLAVLGLPVPDHTVVSGASMVLNGDEYRDKFKGDAIQFLIRLQAAADGAQTPVKWGTLAGIA